MANPNFRRYEVTFNFKGKDHGSYPSGTRAKKFPGGSGAPYGYEGSWQTGFIRSPIATAATPPTSTPAATPPTPIASPSVTMSQIGDLVDATQSSGTVSTPAAMSSPIAAGAPHGYVTVVNRFGVVTAVGHRLDDTPPRHRSGAPSPIAVGARNPIPGVVTAVGHRLNDTPPRHRSRSPPIWVWTSPSTPVTPERDWRQQSVARRMRSPRDSSSDAPTLHMQGPSTARIPQSTEKKAEKGRV